MKTRNQYDESRRKRTVGGWKLVSSSTSGGGITKSSVRLELKLNRIGRPLGPSYKLNSTRLRFGTFVSWFPTLPTLNKLPWSSFGVACEQEKEGEELGERRKKGQVVDPFRVEKLGSLTPPLTRILIFLPFFWGERGKKHGEGWHNSGWAAALLP